MQLGQVKFHLSFLNAPWSMKSLWADGVASELWVRTAQAAEADPRLTRLLGKPSLWLGNRIVLSSCLKHFFAYFQEVTPSEEMAHYECWVHHSPGLALPNGHSFVG
jgi:hypothetical protein